MTLSKRLVKLLKPTKATQFDAPLAPDTPFYAIGDIHGCDHLLVDLLGQIATDAAGQRLPVVCVGDYIDRGADSAAVLNRLHALSLDQPDQINCLMGNHEEMMLAFLDDPVSYGIGWFQNGGLQTLASFGVRGASLDMSADQLQDIRSRFENAIGPELFAWLRQRPLEWSSGNVTVVHAGADPKLPIKSQSRDVLTWGHRDFLRTPRQDGRWIVHGHTINPTVKPINGRIGVDTGAFATGRLSAIKISASGVKTLVSVEGS